MSITSKFLKAGASLMAANTFAQSLTLARNIVIARLMGPEDFGIVATFMILITALTMMSDLGIEKYLQRVPAATVDRVQETLNAILAARGLLLGVLLVLLAPPFAALFERPDLAATYAWLGLVPAIGGFKHLDMIRFQRDLIYLPKIKIRVASLALGTVASIGIVLATGDPTALVWAFVFEAACMAALTHWVAVRPYRLRLDRRISWEVAVYGWPLLLNGLLMYMAGQGDRLLIGTLAGLVALAAYFAMASLATNAALVLMKVMGSLYLPVLSAVQDDPVATRRRNHICGALSTLICITMSVGVILFGAQIVALLFGPEFQVPMALAGWFGLQAGARVLRSWPVAIALAGGHTRDILYANLIRTAGLGVAFGAISAGHGMLGVAASMAAGEVLATFYALARADSLGRTQGYFGVKCGALLCLVAGIALAVSIWGGTAAGALERLGLAAGLCGAAALAILALSPEFRYRVLRGWRVSA